MTNINPTSGYRLVPSKGNDERSLAVLSHPVEVRFIQFEGEEYIIGRHSMTEGTTKVRVFSEDGSPSDKFKWKIVKD